MHTFLKKVLFISLFRRAQHQIWRLRFAVSYYQPHIRNIFRWLKQSNEDTNFTYDLTRLNRQQLAGLIATVTSQEVGTILNYMDELDNNAALNEHVVAKTERSARRQHADLEARYGRRIGWYAIVRATKPRVVVETGVDKGLGSCVLTTALIKNAEEGHPGYYYGTDIDPSAGYLFTNPYTKYGEILYGDSLSSLQSLQSSIDIFVNDSDHSAEYEAREYALIQSRLSTEAIILGDNSHATDSLFNFALATQRNYVFFSETPKDHWYPGAGIGIAFPKSKREDV